MLEKLMSNPIAWLILSISTILGVVLAIYYGVKSKKVKRLSFINKNLFLMENPREQFDNIKIFYEDKEINDIVVSKFTIWNSGNTVINQSDMVETKELIITADDTTTILEAKVLYANEETNRFSVEVLDKNHVLIKFNYIDKNEGCVVQIVYAGSHSCPKIDCKIKEGQPIKNHINDTAVKVLRRMFKKDSQSKIMFILMGILIFSFVVLASIATVAIFNNSLLNTLFLPKNTDIKTLKQEAIIMACLLWLYSLLFTLFYIPTFKVLFKPGIPKSLKNKTDFSY